MVIYLRYKGMRRSMGWSGVDRGVDGDQGEGLFITLEGIERTGKTTQAERIKDYLESRGWSVVLTREPGGTPWAEAIRELLLHRAELGPMDGLTETMLMAAARADHVQRVILPALSEGRAVVCDRFTDSTIAYQGRGLGVDLSHIENLNEMATGGLSPHKTLLLDCPADIMDRRTGAAGTDRIEGRPRNYYDRVRAGFLAQAEKHPHRITVIDGDRSVDAVWSEIEKALEQLLKKKRKTPINEQELER